MARTVSDVPPNLYGGQKIINIDIKNVKVISDASIPINSSINEFFGENGAGKTTIADVIIYCLNGNKSVPDNAISIGEDKAAIEISLTDYLVKAKITKAGNLSMQVLDRDGRKISAAQTFLQQMFDVSSTINPISFLEGMNKESGRKRIINKFLCLLGLDDVVKDSEKKIDDIREERKQDKASKKTYEAIQKDKIYHHNLTEPEETEEQIDKEIMDAMAHNEKIENSDKRIEEIDKEIDKKREKFSSTQDQIRLLKQQLSEINNSVKELNREKEELENGKVKPIALTPLRNKRAEILDYKNKLKENAEYKKNEKHIADLDRKIDKANRDISDIDKEKKILVEQHMNPIPCLEYYDRDLYYNNRLGRKVLLSNASNGEKLVVALEIAKMKNADKDIKLLLIDNAECLTQESRQLIFENAGEFQIIMLNAASIEQALIIENPGSKFFIENGRVRSIPKSTQEPIEKLTDEREENHNAA